MPTAYSEQLRILQETVTLIRSELTSRYSTLDGTIATALGHANDAEAALAAAIADNDATEATLNALQNSMVAAVTALRDASGVNAANAATSAANAAANSSGQNMAGLSGTIFANAVAVKFLDIYNDDDPSWRVKTRGFSMPTSPLAIGEADRILVYDVTGPSPVQILEVLPGGGSAPFFWRTGRNVTSLDYKNGRLYAGLSSGSGTDTEGGYLVFDFIEDKLGRHNHQGYYEGRSIADVNVYTPLAQINSDGLPSSIVNFVNTSLDPAAPYDRLGNRMPDIYASHGVSGSADGGTTIIKYDGSLITIAATGAAGGYQGHLLDVADDGRFAISQTYGTLGQFANIHVFDEVPQTNLPAGTTYTGARRYSYTGGDLQAFGGQNEMLKSLLWVKNDLVFSTENRVSVIRDNPYNGPSGSVRYITANYNAGWAGNVKAALLCSTTIGTMSGAELVTNGGFDGDFTGWNAYNGATIEVDQNRLKATKASSYGGANQQLSGLTIGRKYTVSFGYEKGDFSGVFVWASTGAGGAALGSDAGSDVSGSGKFSFVAASTNPWINMRGELYQSGPGNVWFDNIMAYLDDDNLLPNVAFDSNFNASQTNWYADDATITESSGNLVVSTTGDFGRSVIDISSVQTGTVVSVTAVVASTNTNSRLQVVGSSTGSGAASHEVNRSDAGPLTLTFTKGADSYIALQNNSANSADVTEYSSFSIIRLNGPNLITGAPDLLSERASYSNGTVTVDGSQASTNGDWTYWDIAVTPNQPLRFRADVDVTSTSSTITVGDGDFTPYLINSVGGTDRAIDQVIVPTQNSVRVGFYSNGSSRSFIVSNIILEEVDNLVASEPTLGTGWTKTGDVLFAAGGTSDAQYVDFGSPLTTGQLYQISGRAEGSLDGSNYFTFRTGTTDVVPNITASGDFDIVVEATDALLRLRSEASANNLELHDLKVAPITDLVTNGSFDSTAAGWSDIAGWDKGTIEEGQFTWTNDGTYQGRAQNITGLIPKETYKLTVHVSSSTGFGRIYLGPENVPNGAPAVASVSNIPVGVDHDIYFTAQSATHALGLSASGASDTVTFDSVSVTRVIADRTHNENHGEIVGSIPGVLRGGVVMYQLSDNSGNFFRNDAAIFGIGTGDFYYEQLIKVSGTFYLYDLNSGEETAGGSRSFLIVTTASNQVNDRSGVYSVSGLVDGKYAVIGHGRENGSSFFVVNGTRFEGGNISGFDYSTAGYSLYPGQRFNNISTADEIGPYTITTTIPSADQLKHSAETLLAQLEGPVTLGGTSSNVIKQAHNALEDKYYALTSDGLSTFDTRTWTRLAFDATKAGETGIAAMDQFFAHWNGTRLEPSGPAGNLRELILKKDRHKRYQREWITGNGSTLTFEMKEGHRVKAVTGAGAVGPLRYGEDEAWTNPSNGYREILTFDTAPTGDVAVDVEIAP